MKKIFTLFAAALIAAGANAQEKYGIYNSEKVTSSKAKLSCDQNDDGDDIWFTHTANGVVVTSTYGSATKYYPVIKKQNGASRASDFNSGAFVYKYSGEASVGATWAPNDLMLYASGFRDGKSVDDATITSDEDAYSRFPEYEGDYKSKAEAEEAGAAKRDYTKEDIAQNNPDYWAGMQIDVPAGKQLNVSKIHVAIGAGNNFWWAVNVNDGNGTRLYNSNTAYISNGNSIDVAKQGWHMGFSADITAESVSEPFVGSDIIKSYGEVLTTEIAETAGLKKGPSTAFTTIPANLALTGNGNTVRLYFGIQNSRLFGIGELWVEGTLSDASGINTVEAEGSVAPLKHVENGRILIGDFNIAGQRVK